MGVLPALLCTPLHPNPFPPCLCGCLSVWACMYFPSPFPSLTSQPSTPTLSCCHSSCCWLPGCHSAVTPLPSSSEGVKGGPGGERSLHPALPPPSPGTSTRSLSGGKSRGHKIFCWRICEGPAWLSGSQTQVNSTTIFPQPGTWTPCAGQGSRWTGGAVLAALNPQVLLDLLYSSSCRRASGSATFMSTGTQWGGRISAPASSSGTAPATSLVSD